MNPMLGHLILMRCLLKEGVIDHWARMCVVEAQSGHWVLGVLVNDPVRDWPFLVVWRGVIGERVVRRVLLGLCLFTWFLRIRSSVRHVSMSFSAVAFGRLR